MGTMDSFRKVIDESPVSADVMRFSCFSAPDKIAFELLLHGAPHINPELARLLETCEDKKAAILSVLEPLQRNGLIEINLEEEIYSTTPEIQQEIIERDDT